MSLHRLQRAIRAFLALSWAGRFAFAQAWMLLLTIAVALRVRGFSRVHTTVLDRDGAGRGSTDLATAHSLARLVDSAANWSPAPSTCLVRSITLCRLLRQRGLSADLRIGVSTPGSEFLAHAWVEHAGVALADAGAASEQYASFDRTIVAKRA